jgi:hypothetical protein
MRGVNISNNVNASIADAKEKMHWWNKSFIFYSPYEIPVGFIPTGIFNFIIILWV